MHIAFEVAFLRFKMWFGDSLLDVSQFACYVENDLITTQDDGFTPSIIFTHSYGQAIIAIISGVTPNDSDFLLHVSVSENGFPR